MAAYAPGAAGQRTSVEVAFAPIPFSNRSRATALVWVFSIASRGKRSLRARWRLMGSAGCEAAWLNPHWPLVVWPCDRIGAVRCSLPRVMFHLGARLGLRSMAAMRLCRLELSTMLQHGEHDDGESARERYARLAPRRSA